VADSEVRQKFEARTSEDLLQLALELYARAVSYDCAESVHAAAFAAREEILKRMSGFAAGMRAGEIAMKEKAQKAVADEMPCDCGFDENPVRYKYSSESGHAMNCNQYAALEAIHALPLSGAEESKK
jgi:hypothetical protein